MAIYTQIVDTKSRPLIRWVEAMPAQLVALMSVTMTVFGQLLLKVGIKQIGTVDVGELPADASEAQGAFVSRPDGSWLVDGSAAMEDVATHFGMDALPEDEAGAYHTIGGFVMARLGRVPKVGDCFEFDRLRFEVLDMDRNRVDKVLLAELKQDGPDSGVIVDA